MTLLQQKRMTEQSLSVRFPSGISNAHQYLLLSLRSQVWRDIHLWTAIEWYASLNEHTDKAQIESWVRSLIARDPLPNVTALLSSVVRRVAVLFPDYRLPVNVIEEFVYKSPVQLHSILHILGPNQLQSLEWEAPGAWEWFESFLLLRMQESIEASTAGVQMLARMRRNPRYPALLKKAIVAALNVGNFQPVMYAYANRETLSEDFVLSLYDNLAFRPINEQFLYGVLMRVLEGQQLLLSMLYPNATRTFCPRQNSGLVSKSLAEKCKGKMYQTIDRLEEILSIKFCGYDILPKHQIELCKFISHPMTMKQFRDIKLLLKSKPSVYLGKAVLTPEGTEMTIPVVLKAERNSWNTPTRGSRREFYLSAHTLNLISEETHHGFAPVLGTFDCNCSQENPFASNGWICPDTSIESSETWSYVVYEEVLNSVPLKTLIIENVRHPWFAGMKAGRVWRTIFMIAVIALLNCLVAHEKFQFTHYDLHAANILVQQLPKEHEFKYYFPSVRHTEYKLPIDLVFRSMFRPVIIDYGRSFVSIEQVPCGDPLSHYTAQYDDVIPNPLIDLQLLLTSLDSTISEAGHQGVPPTDKASSFIRLLWRTAELPREVPNRRSGLTESDRQMIENNRVATSDQTIAFVSPEKSFAMRRAVVDTLAVFIAVFYEQQKVSRAIQQYQQVQRIRYQWAWTQMYDLPVHRTAESLVSWLTSIVKWVDRLDSSNPDDRFILNSWGKSILQACFASLDVQELWVDTKMNSPTAVEAKTNFLNVLLSALNDNSRPEYLVFIERLLPYP